MVFFYVLYLLCISTDASPLRNNFDPADNYKASRYQKYSFKIIRLASNTYGYEIYNGSKLFIKQLTIPGIAGTGGFRKKSDAEKVANLVTSKLSKGIMPPTIEKSEMDQLKIRY